ncbi:MAG: TonB-dependent receptor [Bacteroidota bacterium]
MRLTARVVCGLAVLALASQSAPASGTTGNIKGKITDVQTNEALLGVNVLVVGSGRGAVTNERGEYFITSVTPGTFALRVSLLGYQMIESRKIEIKADETTVMNFRLASTDIEMEGITVEGTPPLVDVTKTAGDQTFNRDKIEQLPNVKGVEDVLNLQAGVVKFGNQLFLRGGRANETQILIDGIAVNDVAGQGGAAGSSTANEQLQQLYSGNTSGGVGGAISVSANAIQSVSVSSSGLDPEYGNAQSGVVNITTKGGGDSYSGSGQFRTDGPTQASYNEDFYSANFGGPEPVTTYLLPSLGVEIPGKLSFFMSGNFTQSDGAYAFTTTNFYNPLKRRVRFGGLLDWLNAGFTYSDRQDNSFTYNTKFTYNPGENDIISYSYIANARSGRPLYGSYNWKDRADSTSSDLSLKGLNSLQWTHFFGTNSQIQSFFSRQEIDRTTSVGGLSPDQYSTITTLALRDPSSDGFYDLGTSQGWSTSNSLQWNFKVMFNSQVHEYHTFRAGGEYFKERHTSTVLSLPRDPRRDTTSTRGEYPGYGFARWVGDNAPQRGAFYVQDKIQLSSINVNIGLRYDWLYLGPEVFDPEWVGRWRSVTRDEATWLEHESFFSQFIRGNFSPRLSIGYPISTRTVFYFNYGHFLQYPERDQYYRDPIITSLTGNYVGNPALEPQRTVQYEAGFDQLLLDDLSLGIRGFYKDIFDYPSFQALVNAPLPTDKYVNLDYASARGFEVIVTKQLTSRYQGSVNYTFQLAKGRSSDPRAALGSSSLQGLPREVRLDWDQQHSLNLFLAYRVGPREDFDILGLPFDNWGVSLTWNFGSGFPYTPFDPTIRGGSLAELYLKNTGDGPYTSEVNLSMFKGFTILDKLSLTLSLDVINVFDRRNVDLNAGGWNSFTGRPTIFGDYETAQGNIYSWTPSARSGSFEARVPPYIFRSPRQIAFGVRLNWD